VELYLCHRPYVFVACSLAPAGCCCSLRIELKFHIRSKYFNFFRPFSAFWEANSSAATQGAPPAAYKTAHFTSVFARVNHWTQPGAKRFSSQPVSLWYPLILSSCLHLRLPSDLSGFRTRICTHFSSTRACYMLRPSHFTYLDDPSNISCINCLSCSDFADEIYTRLWEAYRKLMSLNTSHRSAAVAVWFLRALNVKFWWYQGINWLPVSVK
jgi:hypothetical protein